MTAPLREQFGNFGFTTLNGNHNNSTTSIAVTDGSVFPSAGNFRVRVAQELMLCTARSGNTLTVVRGIEGTAPASHTDLENITSPLTVASVNSFQENEPLFGYSSTLPVGRLVAADGVTPLTASDFTWINQGGAAATDENGTILLRAPLAAGENVRMLKRTAPVSTPYTLIIGLEVFGLTGGGIPNIGLCARQSSSGKFYAAAINSDESNHPWCFAAYTFGSATSFNATEATRTVGMTMPAGKYFWLKLVDDGTDLHSYGGHDGINWYLIDDHDRDSYMTSGGPDEIGWYVNNHNSSSGFECLGRLVHWSTQ